MLSVRVIADSYLGNASLVIIYFFIHAARVLVHRIRVLLNWRQWITVPDEIITYNFLLTK
jgi:hypothetical protein